MMSGLFPNVHGCDWAICVRHAVRVPLSEHVDELGLVRDAFAGWVSAARASYFEGGPFIVVAASYEEAVRFEKAATKLIREQDLYLTVSIVQRDATGRWDEIEMGAAPVSDDEIETELRAFADAGEGADGPQQ